MKFLGPPSSGSVAAQTFARNRGGQYVRSRNGRGGSGDAYFATLAAAWQSLADTERQAWIEFARVNMGVIDSLGQAHTLSGFGWFCRQNLTLHVSSGSTLQPVPAVPAPSAAWSTCVLVSAVITTLALDITIMFPSASSGAAVVSSSGVVTPGTMSAPGRGKWWQNFWAVSWGTTDVSPLTIPLGFAWIAKFGSLPLSGDWLFIGLRPVRFDQAFERGRQRLRIQTS